MYRRFLLPLLLTLLSVAAADAQWRESSGITGHEFTSVLTHNGRVFVGTRSGGLFQESGADFIPLRNGLPIGWIQSLASDASGAIYAGVRDDGNYVSTDNGDSWRRLGEVAGTMTDIATLGSYTFMSTERGLYRSTTGSGVFVISGDDLLKDMAIGSLAIEDGVLFAGSYFTVLRSTDTGTSWSAVTLPDSTHFAVGVGSMVSTSAGLTAVAMRFRFISTDNGLSFSAIVDEKEPMVMKMITDGDTIIAAMDDGLYASTDGGRTFTALAKDDSQPFMDVTRSGNTIIAVTFEKIFTSTDRGLSWTARNPQIHAQGVVALTAGIGVNSSDVYAASDVVYRSTNNGESFQRTNNDSTSLAIRDLETGGSYIFALSGPFSILRSSDRGATWEDVSGVLADSGLPVACFHVDGSTVLAATHFYGLYYSTDNGDTWALSESDPLIPISYPQAYASFNGKIYLATQNYLLESSDDGRTWHESPLTTDGPIMVLSTVRQFLLNGPESLYAATADRVYRLDPDGEWHAGGAIDRPTVFAGQYNYLFAGTAANGVMMSFDYGITWKPFRDFSGGEALTGNAAVIYDLIVANSSTLVAATGSNVWYAYFGGDHVRESLDLPRDLSARYERSDASLHLSMTMPTSARVHVELADLRGRIVRELLDERLDGAIERRFPLDGFPAGIYFVTLRTDNGSMTTKLPIVGW
jgi:photosystem II stability/assembly factor-like uncharacterized protein